MPLSLDDIARHLATFHARRPEPTAWEEARASLVAEGIEPRLLDHELRGRLRYACKVGDDVDRWRVLRRPVPRTWVDFFDPVTGLHGQAAMAPDGTWLQAPRGEQAVLLMYRRRGWGRLADQPLYLAEAP